MGVTNFLLPKLEIDKNNEHIIDYSQESKDYVSDGLYQPVLEGRKTGNNLGVASNHQGAMKKSLKFCDTYAKDG